MIRRYILLAILGIGLILTVFQTLSVSLSFIKSLAIKVDKPLSFRFPAYNSVLQNCVKGQQVDYNLVTHSYMKQLDQAVDALAHVSPMRMVDKKERVCFWLNAYNLLALKEVADHYPKVAHGLLANDFANRKFTIGGQEITLDQLYRFNLLPVIRSDDPLDIFLACGGRMGYPALLNHVIERSDLLSDRKFAVYQFINNPNNVQFDANHGVFRISLFFQWHEDLLEPTYGPIHAFVNSYLPAEQQLDLSRADLLQTFLDHFDWRLNDTAYENTPSKEKK